MSRSADSTDADYEPYSAAASASAAVATETSGAYGREFWFAYLANGATMIALCMLVRYADFVLYLGGSEFQLGLIVGVGAVGSLLMRTAQGVAMDRYGARGIWLLSAALLVASIAGHLCIGTVDGPAIYLVRIVMATSTAGVFGASMTHVSRLAPPARMAEIIGTLGTSGFIGMLIGPQLGDWICSTAEPGAKISREQIDALFLFAAMLCAVALLCAWCATRGGAPPRRRRRPPLVPLVRRYSPGLVLLVAVAVGAGVNLPGTFLRTYAAELNIEKIGLFFAVYAITAFATRLATRRLPERLGNRNLIVVGLASQVASVLLFLAVFDWRYLAIPGAAGGVAHALLFPSVVASVGTAFPARYRGLSTTLALAFFDAGTLLGAPAVGASLLLAKSLALPAYPVTFMLVAGVLALVGVIYWLGTPAPGR